VYEKYDYVGHITMLPCADLPTSLTKLTPFLTVVMNSFETPLKSALSLTVDSDDGYQHLNQDVRHAAVGAPRPPPSVHSVTEP
jgi:hypothetical protein